ncbi:MAG: YeiH family protein [Salinarimonas sp.]
MNAPSFLPRASITGTVRKLGPGFVFAAAVAVVATLLAPAVALVFPIPAMVLALLIGIALNRVAAAPIFQPGLTFCVKKLLRWAVALLGLRIALGDIVDLGLLVALMVVLTMAATIVSGFALARLFGQRAEYGALAGAATAVCGASAALATTTVLPNYKGKEADVAFVVVAVNALSTLAMIAYPALAAALGFDHLATGVLLGATIHDVAQVVGAGYAVSETAGNTAVVVKLFRVFLLLPVVLVIGWWFVRSGGHAESAKVPPPIFAFVFLGLCLVNTAMAYLPALQPVYLPVRDAAEVASTWGLLIAIGALGLGTSLSAIARLGWRHIATVTGTTLVILALCTGALLVI